MFDNHYIPWRKARFDFILKEFGSDFFYNKTLLELGCGFGDLGNMFAEIGCRVVCVDARESNLKGGMKKHPNLIFKQKDLEKPFWDLGKFDIVLNSGLFYHLSNPDEHIAYLADVVNDVLIFETECLDSSDPFGIARFTDPNPTLAYDQSYHGPATSVSPKYIERLFELHNIKYEIKNDPLLNADIHRYDWEIADSGKHSAAHRRLWICKK